MAFAPTIDQLVEDVRILEAKISNPSDDDFLTLIHVYETVSRNAKIIDDDDPDSEVKKGLLEEVKKMARPLTISYLPLEEARLVKQAEDVLTHGDMRMFRQTVQKIEGLNEGAGKVAYDYGWLEWDERPWHVYDVVQTLKGKFIEATGHRYDHM